MFFVMLVTIHRWILISAQHACTDTLIDLHFDIYISWDINASVALFGSMNIFEYDFRDTVAHKSNTLSNVAGRTEKKQISHTCLQCAEVQR